MVLFLSDKGLEDRESVRKKPSAVYPYWVAGDVRTLKKESIGKSVTGSFFGRATNPIYLGTSEDGRILLASRNQLTGQPEAKYYDLFDVLEINSGSSQISVLINPSKAIVGNGIEKALEALEK